MRNKIFVPLFLFLLLVTDGFSQQAFSDFLIQSPKIAKPERGSLKGDFAELGGNALNERSGSFMLDLPLDFATERGKMLIPFKVSYSAGFGISEYGIGFDTTYRIYRFRENGKIDFTNADSFMSPWGQLVLGSDGWWYSKDLREKIKGKLEGDIFTLYLPGGLTATFGDYNELYTEKNLNGKVFSWYLKSVSDFNGNYTNYSYWKIEDDGKSYLNHIIYGGAGPTNDEYRIQFIYDRNLLGLVDFSSGKKIKKNFRISQIQMQVKTTRGRYSPIYNYSFNYVFSAPSPSFYLASIQKDYSSGPSSLEPKIELSYDLPSDFLNSASWKKEQALSSLADTYKGLLTNLNSSTFQDFNNDGLLDIEVGKGYEEYRNINGQFIKNDRPAPSGPASPWCLFPVYNDRRTRKFIQLHQDNTTPYVFDFFTYNSKNLLEVCSLNGERVATIEFPYFWEYGQKTIFADMNNDGLSDVIHLRGDAYEISYNTSDRQEGGRVSFANPQAPIQLFLPPNYSSFWVNDINGDGHADIVLKGDSTIYVHYGHSDGTFEKKYVTYDFYLPNGSISSKDLADAQVLWIDLNKDSLPDILLQGDGFITLHINTGSNFVDASMPGLFVNPQFYQNMAVANLTGAGETQIISAIKNGNENIVMKLDLDRPSLGMLTGVYDGKGKELLVSYNKTSSQAGTGKRRTVVTRMVEKVTGEGTVTNNFIYKNIKKNNVTNNFLGFQTIERTQDAFGKIINNYTYDNMNLYQHMSKIQYDFKNANFISFEEMEYSTKDYNNVKFPLLSKKITGHKVLNGSQKSALTTVYSYDETNLCKTNEIKSSSVQNSETINSYMPMMDEYILSCFETNIDIQGSGLSTNHNYSHKLELVRDDEAKIVEIKKGQQNPVSLQIISYAPKGRVRSISEAGKGTTFFDYDSKNRLYAVINPDATENLISSFDKLDQPLVSTLVRGNVSLVNEYRYDDHFKLQKNWNNLGAFTEVSPSSTYQYIYPSTISPGKIIETVGLEINNGALAQNNQISLLTGSGNTLAKVIETDGNYKIQELTEYKPQLGQASTVKNYLVGEDFDFENAIITDFNFGLEKIATKQNDFLQRPDRITKFFQTNVNKVVESSHEIFNNEILSSDLVNASLTTKKSVDAFGNLTSYLDESNHSFSYSSDSLGRIREIKFPDNLKQLITYDSNSGMVSVIERDNLGRIEYSYDTTNNLLAQKRRYDRNNIYKLREDYSYDGIGRILNKKFTQVNQDGSDGNSTLYSYTYDGLNLSEEDRDGQEGFLTGVSTSFYSKSFTYRADGKVLKNILTIPGFREFKNETSYFSHGAVANTTQTIKDLTNNNVELNHSLSYRYDRLGNVEKILNDNNSFADFSYNSYAQVSEVKLDDKKINYSYDSLTREYRDYKESNLFSTIFQQQWNYNNRGFISNENYQLGSRQIQKHYLYSNRGFISSMSLSDTNGASLTTAYNYDSIGLMTSDSKGSQVNTHNAGLDNWYIGNVQYSVDSLGRVVKKGSIEYTYGENGRISKVFGIGVNEASYLYDENNDPILKILTFGKISVYLGDNIYFDDNYYEPIKIENRVVGYFKNGIFISTSQDHLNSNIVNEVGITNLNLPYGERDTHTEAGVVLDFALKGYDSDLDAIRMGHRYYDSKSKRFLTPDTYFFENSEKILISPIEGNLYSYAGNNPISYKDSKGDCFEPMSAALCTVAAWNAGAMAVAWVAGTIAIQTQDSKTQVNSQNNLNKGIGAGMLAGAAPLAAQAIGVTAIDIGIGAYKAASTVAVLGEIYPVQKDVVVETAKFLIEKKYNETDKSPPDTLPGQITNTALELIDSTVDKYQGK